MKLVQILLGSLVTVLGGTLAGVGAKKAIQIPTLAIRRMVILALTALAGVVVLFTGFFFILRGLAEVAALYDAPWIFSFVIGAIVLVAGAGILFAALRREAWLGETVQETKPEFPPIFNILTQIALDFLADRRAHPPAPPASAGASMPPEMEREPRATPRPRPNVSQGTSQDWTVH